ncbi:copper homeostasis protein CutC [Flavobacterium sp. NRK F7]|uniref:copper homeostasis protein CutC n=1 Tax=Flavobacterium sp. NRK F7 TaxID=2954930 RepID=UPI002090564A|nr:copper homeostasis protein CutC [Flavobacterium sp. NRK F7]MCO6161303.1 copper homeostasis protein CutC [Flavobacterium sp. NRK F7]
MPSLEIACFNLESAEIAQKNGADRIELCVEMSIGGTTPSLEMIQNVKAKINIPIYVMIRPRGGNFVYNETELEWMQSKIKVVKEMGINGFVFGILDVENKVDVIQNKALVSLAKPLPCTFHRAFDEVSNPFQALEELVACGFQTILTSGNAKNVNDGATQLKRLVQKANNRIIIMPGGSLRSSNLKMIQQKTNAIFYHSSAITDGTETADPIEIQRLKSILNE